MTDATSAATSGGWSVWLARALSPLLGESAFDRLTGAQVGLEATWAGGVEARIVAAALAVALVSFLIYRFFQPDVAARRRLLLGTLRGVALATLVLLLAEPGLTVTGERARQAELWLLVDGSQSMGLRDAYPEAERAQLAAALELPTGARAGDAEGPSRLELVQAWLSAQEALVPRTLGERFRLESFVLDGPDGVRRLRSGEGDAVDVAEVEEWSASLEATAEVTALGAALEDLAQRPGVDDLAGLVIVSDFGQNAGPAPLPVAETLPAPIHAVGVGPVLTRDVAVRLDVPLVLQHRERSVLGVTLRQSGFDGVPVGVTLELLGQSDEATPPRVLQQSTVTLEGATTTVDVPFTPQEVGRFTLRATLDPLVGQAVAANDQAEREIVVRDDFLRLLYVEEEPTWEWRFVKEVFHRDKLVGQRGFRTYLRSADPKVREANPLFLPTLLPARGTFFANDVLFLGDVSSTLLSDRFCERVIEFVERFGGGLVIISGPEHGPAALASTKLAKLLPVGVAPASRAREVPPYRLVFRPEAAGVDFLTLGGTPDENATAWADLGTLCWYQPAEYVDPLATVLAEHPSDTCADGVTPQPLIVTRRFGRGEVVYLGFDEFWRLRRKHGERFYRQFWGQMIYRLGLGHALGERKRFVVTSDRPTYRVGEEAVLSVEAFDTEYQPLDGDTAATLTGTHLLPPEGIDGALAARREAELALPLVRPGVFETRVPVLTPGEHEVTVRDPVTGDEVGYRFTAREATIERTTVVRDAALQSELASRTGGQVYELTEIDALLERLEPTSERETAIERVPLGNSWLAFLLVAGCLFGEWAMRKGAHLP